MGEAIITRAGGGEADTVIPITPGYHTILAVIKDPEGGVMANHPVSCKDGSRQYNYTTNAKGQVMFVCNSGAANIFVNNYNGAYRYIDVAAQWKNIDAPVGLTSKVEINLEHPDSLVEFLSSTGFELYSQRVCDINIVGGGGGGGASSSYDVGVATYNVGGGGGGAGYMNNYTDQKMYGIYNFIAGAGGGGGTNWQNPNGASGGTSYIANTNYSAIGGGGGGGETHWHSLSQSYVTYGGKGGLGSGAMGIAPGDAGDDITIENLAQNSPVNFAGGGGGSGISYIYNTVDANRARGGSPYGGMGAVGYNNLNQSRNTSATPGSRGGGGAGADAGQVDEGDNWYYDYYGGGGGGGGYLNYKNGASGPGLFDFTAGAGGYGASWGRRSQGGTGGTSLLKFNNVSLLSANGGTGGYATSAGVGGGNGGRGASGLGGGGAGLASGGLLGGGGGGGAGGTNRWGTVYTGGRGGSPYGGNGGTTNQSNSTVGAGTAGRLGGGGGGGGGGYYSGGSGGAGGLVINIRY